MEGKQLICDFPGEEFCHGTELVSSFAGVFDDEDEIEENKLDAFCVECVLEAVDEDDDADAPDDLAPALRFFPSIEQVNEIVRSGAARLDQERPVWLDSWVRIISIIRLALVPVFWEMCSGKAGLTR